MSIQSASESKDQQLHGNKIELAMRESPNLTIRQKIIEGGAFFGRGISLLARDMGHSKALISKALHGLSLDAQELAELRRFVLDLLTVVPFTVILITPMTPIGHVLVIGMIQRYFPELLPSQFSSQRQHLEMEDEQQLGDALLSSHSSDDIDRNSLYAREVSLPQRSASNLGPKLGKFEVTTSWTPRSTSDSIAATAGHASRGGSTNSLVQIKGSQGKRDPIVRQLDDIMLEAPLIML